MLLRHRDRRSSIDSLVPFGGREFVVINKFRSFRALDINIIIHLGARSSFISFSAFPINRFQVALPGAVTERKVIFWRTVTLPINNNVEVSLDFSEIIQQDGVLYQVNKVELVLIVNWYFTSGYNQLQVYRYRLCQFPPTCISEDLGWPLSVAYCLKHRGCRTRIFPIPES